MNIKQKLTQIGIGFRLASLTTVTILTAITVFFIISTSVQRRQAIDLVSIHSANLSQSIEHILRFSMEKNRREEIRLAIHQLSQSDDIVEISLLNHQGEVIYGSPDSLVGTLISTDHYTCSGCHISDTDKPLKKLSENLRSLYQPEREMALTIMPIYSESTCFSCHNHKEGETVLGIIEIVLSTQYIKQTLKSSHLNLLLYSIAIALFVLTILMYFRRWWIIKPVRELIEGTRKVAKGDLDHIITPGVAELGELATAFNSMQTKLKSSQQQLIMSAKLASIGKLAAGVAHEINNPLTGILAFTEGLMEESAEDDGKQKDLQIIKRETLRCRKIVQNLLDFTRQDKPEFDSININVVLERTMDLVYKQALFSKMKISLILSESLPSLFVDSGQMQEVFLNLMVNAAEASPNGAIILITTRYIIGHNEVEISVKDTGPGINESVLPYIFDPFFSTKKGKTNGLGLSVVWGIIEQHRGRINVSSVIGRGTTFQIYLPVR